MQRTNVFAAAAWMVAITVALFFVPLVNGLVGGAVGGFKAGSAARALTAAVIPAAIVAVVLWIVLAALEAPVFGALAGLTAGGLILLADAGIFIGALVGGLVAQRRHPEAAV